MHQPLAHQRNLACRVTRAKEHLALIVVASALASLGILMAPLGWGLVALVLGAAVGFALILDQIRPLATSMFRVQ